MLSQQIADIQGAVDPPFRSNVPPDRPISRTPATNATVGPGSLNSLKWVCSCEAKTPGRKWGKAQISTSVPLLLLRARFRFTAIHPAISHPLQMEHQSIVKLKLIPVGA